MNREFQIVLLAIEFFLVCGLIDKKVPIIFFCANASGFDFMIQHLLLTHMVSHIGFQYHTNHAFSEHLFLIFLESFNKVALLLE